MLFFVRFVILPKKSHEIVYCEGKVDRISITNLKTYLVQKLFKVKGWDGEGLGNEGQSTANWSATSKGENVRFIVNTGTCIDM